MPDREELPDAFGWFLRSCVSPPDVAEFVDAARGVGTGALLKWEYGLNVYYLTVSRSAVTLSIDIEDPPQEWAIRFEEWQVVQSDWARFLHDLHSCTTDRGGRRDGLRGT